MVNATYIVNLSDIVMLCWSLGKLSQWFFVVEIVTLISNDFETDDFLFWFEIIFWLRDFDLNSFYLSLSQHCSKHMCAHVITQLYDSILTRNSIACISRQNDTLYM